MMTTALLGSAGMGLMWGWLVGIVGDMSRHGPLHRLVLVGATLLFALEVLLFTEWQALALFLGATALSWVLHTQWQRELRRRFGPPVDHQRGG
jgi:hypothetical protein